MSKLNFSINFFTQDFSSRNLVYFELLSWLKHLLQKLQFFLKKMYPKLSDPL